MCSLYFLILCLIGFLLFERKINKKEKTIGLFSVLSDKIKDGKLVVVDNLELSAPKTKELAAKLKDLQGKISGLGRKLTIVISDKQKALVRAGKNLPNVTILSASSLNILQLISSHGIIVMQDALPIIEKIYLRKK